MLTEDSVLFGIFKIQNLYENDKGVLSYFDVFIKISQKIELLAVHFFFFFFKLSERIAEHEVIKPSVE